VILQDELGICDQLDALMDNLVNTYQDEWAQAVQGKGLMNIPRFSS
jgi:nitrite reductase (NAD(P)H)